LLRIERFGATVPSSVCLCLHWEREDREGRDFFSLFLGFWKMGSSTLLLLVVFVFDLVAFALAVAAEQRRNTVSYYFFLFLWSFLLLLLLLTYYSGGGGGFFYAFCFVGCRDKTVFVKLLVQKLERCWLFYFWASFNA